MATQAGRQTGSAPAPAAAAHPAVRDYTLVCLVALLVMAAVLAQEPVGWWWPFVPVLLGGVALLGRWTTGPPLVLVSVTGVYLVQFEALRYFGALWPGDPVTDGLLAAALLAYVVGHYRLQSLTGGVVPEDRRPAAGKGGPARRWFLPAPPARSPGGVRPGEVLGLLLSVPLFVVLAFLAWGVLAEAEPFPMVGRAELPQRIGRPWRNPEERYWQTVLVVWLFAGAVAAAGSALAYLRWARSSGEEALVYLQDQLWQQTRREQRRANRWLAWCRLRRQRRREGR
jgi:hypothetical protein